MIDLDSGKHVDTVHRGEAMVRAAAGDIEFRNRNPGRAVVEYGERCVEQEHICLRSTWKCIRDKRCLKKENNLYLMSSSMKINVLQSIIPVSKLMSTECRICSSPRSREAWFHQLARIIKLAGVDGGTLRT